MVADQLAAHPQSGYEAVGFLDDDPEKRGRTVAGLEVLGAVEDLPAVVDEHRVRQIVIAIPTASGSTVRRVVAGCEEVGCPFKIVPGIWEIIRGDVTISQIRELELTDLLGRETVTLDAAEMTGYIKGKCVLVTGAGGSIGSELVRQIASFRPGKLLLMGRGENSIFDICQDMDLDFPGIVKLPIIGSVGDIPALERLFAFHRPDIVYHAAAHKHVHLMEYFPHEAIRNNVTGTRTLIDMAVRHGVDRLVMLSTDKAVEPAGVMGASKRLAELLLQDEAARGCRTKLMAVRFGNVLGSRGSVIPMFRKQIARGGPVTVTHPDVTRYFMTIKEAVMLVLEAGFLGEGGEIFVLDMGEPIRIATLAEHLVRLSGLEAGADIHIEYCGLRPGEKLHEELWHSGEDLTPTRYDKIMVVKAGSEPRQPSLGEKLKKLEELAEMADEEGILSELAGLFPGFESRGRE